MSNKSSIEWTATVNPDGSVTPGSTWNPVRGCVKVSPGCKNCYAETFAERWRGVPGHPYEHGFDLRLVPEKLEEPLKWKKPRRVFVNSMSDLFQEGVPFEFIDRVFAVMALCPQHTFQILTKRPERMREYMSSSDQQMSAMMAEDVLLQKLTGHGTMGHDWPLPNVWLGVSVENQQYADERIPLLLQTPAAVRFVSYEPALGPVDFEQWIWPGCIHTKEKHDAEHDAGMWCDERALDWIIVGGESGPGARPFDVKWARDARFQCGKAGTAFFMKQMGSVTIMPGCRQNHWDWGGAWGHTAKFSNYSEEPTMWRIHLKDRKGGDIEEWPSDLRVRQFPKEQATECAQVQPQL